MSVIQAGPANGAGALVSAKLVVPAPGTVAFMKYDPDCPLAVSVGAVATPAASVVVTANRLLVLGNAALTPAALGLTVQVTASPLAAGVVVTLIGVANDWPGDAFCASPLVFTIVFGSVDATQPISRSCEKLRSLGGVT